MITEKKADDDLKVVVGAQRRGPGEFEDFWGDHGGSDLSSGELVAAKRGGY